ncbi:MAG: YdcF family protein, partial [Deltaproteobacteria bacterium]|nr:YdcF family protein [Deltaproteobacteria bacterium]
MIIALLMWSLSITPTQDVVLRGLEAGFSIPMEARGDVIILLGGGIYDGVPDFSGIGRPS